MYGKIYKWKKKKKKIKDKKCLEILLKRKIVVVTGVFLIGSIMLDPSAVKEEPGEFIVFFYFASTQFGTSTVPENIENIKKIKIEFSEKYKSASIKFVMVCLNHDFDKALKFIKKHGDWDEISIGKSFVNELALNLLNMSDIPKVPHILVFKYRHEKGNWNLPVIKKRELLADLAGDEEIQAWADKGFPLSFVKKPAASSMPDNNDFPNDGISDLIKKRRYRLCVIFGLENLQEIAVDLVKYFLTGGTK